jgi:hypothetical protein
MLIIGMIVR